MSNKKKVIQGILLIAFSIMILFLLNNLDAVTPQGPDDVNYSSNTTKGNVSAKMINISGGRILSLNMSSTTQNERWKAFVGHIIGKYTLDDSGGSTIFDWTFTTTTGRVYATRNATSVAWGSINCSNITHLINEDTLLQHSNPDDNITRTFNATYNNVTNTTDSGGHNAFYAADTYIPATTCPTLNTFVNNNTQDAEFEEIALYDGVTMVYATIMEDDGTGYNGQSYDFQMIVPENGNTSFQGATAYYVYVQLGT